MIMWAMSDRAIPRSLRMMEGFGVNTFRLLNDKDEATFVKFHWRPKLGTQSTCWDEAVKIAGADPGLPPPRPVRGHRRGRLSRSGSSACSCSARSEADALPFDILDATKLIPEELVPIRVVGRMVLDRNPDNFFAETEQVAFLPTNMPPGIDFSEDPLLQGRLFSYQDTQLSRLGTVNFHQLPINQAKGCPFQNLQRDGHMQTQVPKGRANYEPNSLAAGRRGGRPARGPARAASAASPCQWQGQRCGCAPRPSPTTTARRGCSTARRPRSSRRTWRSALVFELSKVHARARAHAGARQPAQRRRDAGQARRRRPERGPARRNRRRRSSRRTWSRRRPCASSANIRQTLKGRAVGILVTRRRRRRGRSSAVRKAAEAEGAHGQDRRAQDRRRDAEGRQDR